MFQRLFGRAPAFSRDVTDALYEQIVAAARQPVLYSDWNVPDTPLGRFEMLSLHMLLVQHRLRPEQEAFGEIAQVLIDQFFTDLDHSLRELGIGDLGVPKRIKKLAKMFYGRTASYAEALDRDDRAALSAALARNVRPGVEDWAEAPALAAYAMQARDGLDAQPASAILTGKVTFPSAGGSA
jgi:cytochrome b pre-mRNA-processing protein 3